MGQGTLTLIEGKLKGLGLEARCEVLARRLAIDAIGMPLQRPYIYTDCSVIGAPAELPDGDYNVYFDGHSFEARSLRGHWFSRGLATQVSKLRPTLVA
jgi:hypothetical protein